MKYLIIGLLLVSCGKQQHEVKIKAPEKDVINDSKHTFGFDFDAVRTWCEGNINHSIATCEKVTPNLCQEIIDDKEYLIDECYYGTVITLDDFNPDDFNQDNL